MKCNLMKRNLSVFSIAIAVALLFATVAWAQQEARFSFNTKVMVSMSGYMLPPGQYTLERVGTTDVFRLRKGSTDSDPIATIDAWDTLTPKKVDTDTMGTKAVLTILDPDPGESVRALEGFSINGEYFKIRDVLSMDRSVSPSK